MEKVYEVTKPGRLNKRKVLGKENRAVLIKKAMLKFFKAAFIGPRSIPKVSGDFDLKKQKEIEAINKRMEETKQKIEAIRNKEGELSIADTRNLHIYNKHLIKMNKMKLKRENNYVRFEKIKNVFFTKVPIESSVNEVVNQTNERIAEMNNVNLPASEVKELEKQLSDEVAKELEEQETVASTDISTEEVTPTVEETNIATPVVEEKKIEPPVEKKDFDLTEMQEMLKKLIFEVSKLDELNQKINGLQEENTKNAATIEEMKKTIQGKEEKWNQEKIELERKNANLTQNIQSLTVENKKLSEEKETLKADNKRLSEENQKVTGSIEALYNNLNSNVNNPMNIENKSKTL